MLQIFTMTHIFLNDIQFFSASNYSIKNQNHSYYQV